MSKIKKCYELFKKRDDKINKISIHHNIEWKLTINLCLRTTMNFDKEIGLWYTTNKMNEIIRITATNDLSSLSTFVKQKDECLLMILSFGYSDYNNKSELKQMKSIKDDIKKICHYNYINGNGYKLLEYNIE